MDVLTAGEAMALLLAEDAVPLGRAERFARSVAGSESNVAIGLARLGHTVAFCGRVGADAAGGWVRDTLRAEGVDVTALHTDPRRPTGLLLRDRPAGGRPVSVAYYRTGSAATALAPADVDEARVATARMVFVSGITAMLSPSAADFTDRLIAAASAAGVPVAFDPNVRLRLAAAEDWRRMYARFAGRMDTLLLSGEELRRLGLAPDARTDPAGLLSGRTTTVVVTHGAAGATATTAAGTVHAAASPVSALDPVGAGDAFTAGWLSARLRGLPPADALREAAAVAALVVAVPTDIAGLPTPAERDRLLSTGGDDVDR
ncbi:sugar kinase [Dactylosporangium sp. NPDC051541]|uniref:sugar kinase n=1 Tax=Dactylosporangium sp. NPDC051541 TaxID=3363977 RepID=UPI0037A51FE1